MSPELRLVVHPRETYAVLARATVRITPLTALRRPALVAVIVGVTLALSSTRHVTPALVLTTTTMWSVVVIVQMAIALALIAGPARSTVGPARAFDLFFASHAPWSLWLLADAAWAQTAFGHPSILLTLAAVPIVLTPRMIEAFFREVLELPPRRARNRTLLHQAVTWGMLLALGGTAVAIWPRVLEWVG